MMNREQYDNSVHKLGRITNTIALFTMLAAPLLVMIVTGVFPSIKQLLNVTLPIAAVWFISGGAEFFAFIPVLGVSGSYLAFVTGNISNMKLPASISAQASLDLEQGSEKGEIVSTLAIATSSLVTLVILVVGLIGLTAITPILDNPVLKPGFSNVMPALIGAFGAPFILKNAKKTIIPIIFVVLLNVLIIPNVSAEIALLLQGLLMTLVIAVSVSASYISYVAKKGKA